MPLIFGLDIGTTSIGFAVIEHDEQHSTGKIHRLGVRIFPEARDPKGVPLNQARRQARLRRRQLRRRRERRLSVSKYLHQAGLLPDRKSSRWDEVMKQDPYELRRLALEGESLSPNEIGRAIYHLAQRRHFKSRDIDEISDGFVPTDNEADDTKTASAREEVVRALNCEGVTLGAWLARRGNHERKRGKHATRKIVEDEFDRVWQQLIPEEFRSSIRHAIFSQRPVFWRLNTLGDCRFIPGSRRCAKSTWISQQRRMLEKLNNLSLVGREQRNLDDEERQAILEQLQSQTSMTWLNVRRALAPLYRRRGNMGEERALKFNLEEGGERTLLGNPVEAKLEDIFGSNWKNHPSKFELRKVIPELVWQADYELFGNQRVIIRSAVERGKRREVVAIQIGEEFGLSDVQVNKIKRLKLPSGWEPYSMEALEQILPYLEAGVRFGALINGPEWEQWRRDTFPAQKQSTGEVLDRLPSPINREEDKHIVGLRNPTVARTRNELRKVVNNLIDMFGKPDRICVEVARDVGNSKRQREEKRFGIRRQERRRKAARDNLQKNGFLEPSRTDVEKWVLWEECGHRCPYTGDSISFEALFLTRDFEVEHIWPRSRSLDNSFKNKTLCRIDVNKNKGNLTPYEFFHNNPEGWDVFVNRLDSMKASRGGTGMSLGKIRRFQAPSIPEDFVSRQLNDTGYAAREAVTFLKKLWPDLGSVQPVNVQAVSGRVTAHLRRLWGLNNILDAGGVKTRADHRHHAVDALTVACCHPGITQKLSRFWQQQDDPRALQPCFSPPWETIRVDAEAAIESIVVSHRVRRKVSGPLHKETVYGDTGEDDITRPDTTYRYFVTRKKVEALTKKELDEIAEQGVREIAKAWVDA